MSETTEQVQETYALYLVDTDSSALLVARCNEISTPTDDTVELTTGVIDVRSAEKIIAKDYDYLEVVGALGTRIQVSEVPLYALNLAKIKLEENPETPQKIAMFDSITLTTEKPS